MMYRFSGAAPEVISEKAPAALPGILTFKLETNYRSTDAIVEASKRLITHNYGAGGYDPADMKDLQARPDAPEGTPPSFDIFETPEDEADFVASGISQYLDTGRQPADFFVGARTRAQLSYIESALFSKGIAYINIAGGSFWTLAHIADVIAYLKLSQDDTDKAAFRRIYNKASKDMVYPWGQHQGEKALKIVTIAKVVPRELVGRVDLHRLPMRLDRLVGPSEGVKGRSLVVVDDLALQTARDDLFEQGESVLVPARIVLRVRPLKKLESLGSGFAAVGTGCLVQAEFPCPTE